MSFAHQQLRSFVDRVCRLNDEIKTLNGDKSEIYKEARAEGFDPKVLKAAVRRFEQLKADRLGVQEFDALLDIYMGALLGHEASDDQGEAETPPALTPAPANGIQKSPTRACAEALPPHDEVTGELIEEPDASTEAECRALSELTTGPASTDVRQGPGRPSEPEAGRKAVEGETAPVSGDVGENTTAETSRGRPAGSGADASPNIPHAEQGSAVPVLPAAANEPNSLGSVAASFDMPEMPDFLRRRVA